MKILIGSQLYNYKKSPNEQQIPHNHDAQNRGAQVRSVMLLTVEYLKINFMCQIDELSVHDGDNGGYLLKTGNHCLLY